MKKTVVIIAAMLMGGLTCFAQNKSNQDYQDIDNLLNIMQDSISRYVDIYGQRYVDSICWTGVRDANIHRGYAAYSLLFPNGDSVETARSIMKNLEEADWKKAKMSSNWMTVFEFCMKYQYGYYYADALSHGAEIEGKSSEDISELFTTDGFCASPDSSIIFIANVDNDGDRITFKFSRKGKTIITRTLLPGQYQKIKIRNGSYDVTISGSPEVIPTKGLMNVERMVYRLMYYVCPVGYNNSELYADSRFVQRAFDELLKITSEEDIKQFVRFINDQPDNHAFIEEVNGERNLIIEYTNFDEDLIGGLFLYSPQQRKKKAEEGFVNIELQQLVVNALYNCGMGVTYKYTGTYSHKKISTSFSAKEIAEINRKIEKLKALDDGDDEYPRSSHTY